MSKWHVNQLVELVKRRYPKWSGFNDPDYLEDEVTPKHKLVEEANALLNLERLDGLIAEGNFEEIWQSLLRLTQKSNLLWRRVPGAGDTAVLHAPDLKQAEFSIQVRNLLYGDRNTAVRLQTFSNYLEIHQLPNKWPLPTFLLFLTHPESELFIKPQPAKWFLKFMGSHLAFPTQPDMNAYAHIRGLADELLNAFQAQGATDMIDIQSLIWIGMRESKSLTGKLDARTQIDLDVPPTPPLETPFYTQSHPLESVHEVEQAYESGYYSLAQMVQETGVDKEEIERWHTAVLRKKQVVFYGPPGTGKTFVSQKLARLLTAVEGEPRGFFEIVQFHPAYSYEDFVSGLRPVPGDNGQATFVQTPGRFMQFCDRARAVNGRCVLIIDEINRANLPAVFGELMMMLEYRDSPTQLAGGQTFTIPSNVYIIATMNSADRSLALVDFALRRRFSFISLHPNFQLLNSQPHSESLNKDALITLLHEINQLIDDPNYAIGHTYFLQPNLEKHLQDIWQMEIYPYLREYFFDAPNRIERYQWEKIASRLVN